jgi:hypothetical protein
MDGDASATFVVVSRGATSAAPLRSFLGAGHVRRGVQRRAAL